MVIRNNATGKNHDTTIAKWSTLSPKAQALFTIVEVTDSGEVSEQPIQNTSAPAAAQKNTQRPATGDKNTSTDKKSNAKNQSSKNK